MLVGPPYRGHRNWADKSRSLRRVSTMGFPGAPSVEYTTKVSGARQAVEQSAGSQRGTLK